MTQKSSRLQSLDALRGFDMFWILSSGKLVRTLADITHASILTGMAKQLSHSSWNGFVFYDMIFPLFIFIAGVSMPFSMDNQLAKAMQQQVPHPKRKIYYSLIRRTILLLLLGMVVNGALQFEGYEQTRFASVLGRIGLSCFFAALIYLNTGLRGQITWFAGLLLGYWAIMMLIPVPGYGAGVLTPEGNLEGYIDRLLLPGRLHDHVYDPEGLLSTIPAIASALLGTFAGRFLRMTSPSWSTAKKGIALLLAGLLLLALGALWGLVFPINKHMWTSSFMLYAGGWSLVLLSVFYLIIDVAGYKKWSIPFIWIGTNSIAIYLVSHGLIDFKYTAGFLFGGLIDHTALAWQPAWLLTGALALQIALAYFLYRNKLFLKV